MLQYSPKPALIPLLLSFAVCGCHPQNEINSTRDPQIDRLPLGLLSLQNSTPVYMLSSEQGKLVPSDTLIAHVDEPGEAITTVSIQGYAEFGSPPPRQPHGWWQLGEYPPFFYIKMQGPARLQSLFNNTQENAIFPQSSAHRCPLLTLDPNGRLVPTSKSTSATVDVYGLEEHYVQLAQHNMVFASRECVDALGENPFDIEGYLNETSCPARVKAMQADAQQTSNQEGYPYIIFCFDNDNREKAWTYTAKDTLGYLNLLHYNRTTAVNLYNVSASEGATATYGNSETIVTSNVRLPLFILDARAMGEIVIAADDGSPPLYIIIPVNTPP